eukprot:9060837-Pyramimonas_sp.AAC.1
MPRIASVTRVRCMSACSCARKCLHGCDGGKVPAHSIGKHHAAAARYKDERFGGQENNDDEVGSETYCVRVVEAGRFKVVAGPTRRRMA